MSYISNQHRVGQEYEARQRDPRAARFGKYRTNIAESILADHGDAAAQQSALDDLMSHLAGADDKLADEFVYDDDADGGLCNSLAIVWATRKMQTAAALGVDEAREFGERNTFLVKMVIEAAGGKGLTAGMIRGLLNVMRAEVLREQHLIDEAVPFGTEEEEQERSDNAGALTSLVTILHKWGESRQHARMKILGDDDHGPIVLRLKRRGRWAGSVDVTSEGDYEGRSWYGAISAEGEPRGRLEDHTWAMDALRKAAVDPEAAARLYGQTVGECCFCAKALVERGSVLVGYGPICADKIGLPHPQNDTMTMAEAEAASEAVA